MARKDYTADRRLFLTSDRARVVEAGDPEAAFLYAVPGRTVPREEAERYGLVGAKAEAEPDEAEPDEKPAAAKAESAPPSTKAETKAPATKAVAKPAATKAAAKPAKGKKK